mmetsp:Transcript_6335/g.9756  ORF Transcript_6335/g.9756 Transcript_6335/m.9756 type:complete len:399 (+) Transcript_6335:84-1280(+)
MASSSSPPSQPPLSVTLVGCGQIVTHHLEAMMKLNYSSSITFQIHALCDPSVERRQVIRQQWNNNDNDDMSEYNTMTELFNSSSKQVDIIFIAVPHDLHESLALEALQHTEKTMVVMEKPLAPTYAACQRLLEASSRYGNRLYIAEQSPYWPAVALAKQMVADGKIGTLLSASSYYYESMRDNITSGSTSETGGLGWRGSLQRAGGGIAMDGGLHWIRPLREVCGGRITKVCGVIRPNLAPQLEMEGEALGHALLEIDTTSDSSSPYRQPDRSGPLIATYSCHMLATAPMAHDACPYFRFTGTEGELIILGTGLQNTTPGAGDLKWYHDSCPQGQSMLEQTVGGFFLGFQGLWQEIYRTIESGNGEAAHESVVRAADDVKVVLGLYQSHETRTWQDTN